MDNLLFRNGPPAYARELTPLAYSIEDPVQKLDVCILFELL